MLNMSDGLGLYRQFGFKESAFPAYIMEVYPPDIHLECGVEFPWHIDPIQKCLFTRIGKRCGNGTHPCMIGGRWESTLENMIRFCRGNNLPLDPSVSRKNTGSLQTAVDGMPMIWGFQRGQTSVLP